MIELKLILEALLFAADRPLTPADLRAVLVKAAEQTAQTQVRALRKVKIGDIESALQALAGAVDSAERTYRLVCVAGAWQFVVLPEYAPWLRALAGERVRPSRLSQPALETLAIIAYRQPITRAEIEQIRGVSVDGVMQTLLERGLVEPAGRAEVVGRPIMYATTKAFLEYFGLAGLDKLPDAEELRRLPVERPPGLVTVEHGLATVPPEQLAAQPAAAPDAQKPAAVASDEPDGSRAAPAEEESPASEAIDSSSVVPNAPQPEEDQSESGSHAGSET